MKLTELKNKKILILGFGREGADTYLFLRKLFPEKSFGIADRQQNLKNHIRELQLPNPNLKSKIKSLIKKDNYVKWHLGKDYLKFLRDYDVIIKSPGIPPKVVAPFVTKKQKITSQTEIFFEECSNPIIGVTGTKGKGTTSLLIYHLLRTAGLPVRLIGNIGNPCLSSLLSIKKDILFVYELSSHQLYKLKKSPQIALLLNIYPEHLDYYYNLQDYINAKANITRYQKEQDWLIYNSADKIVCQVAKKSKARLVAFDRLRVGERLAKKFPLPGAHNLLNLKASLATAKIFGISEKHIEKALKNFKGLAHRLEFVGRFQGINFYNDSAATIPEATIAALETLGEKLQTIILGGSEKKSNYAALAKKVLKSKIKNVILFPSTGEKIWQEIVSSGSKLKLLPKPFFVNSMKEAVAIAFQETRPGGVVLLSPASASFTLFRDYQERGNLFKKYVKLKSKVKSNL